MWFWSEPPLFTLIVQWLILQSNRGLRKKIKMENVLQKHTGKNYYCVYICITILRPMCERKEGLRTFPCLLILGCFETCWVDSPGSLPKLQQMAQNTLLERYMFFYWINQEHIQRKQHRDSMLCFRGKAGSLSGNSKAEKVVWTLSNKYLLLFIFRETTFVDRILLRKYETLLAVHTPVVVLFLLCLYNYEYG